MHKCFRIYVLVNVAFYTADEYIDCQIQFYSNIMVTKQHATTSCNKLQETSTSCIPFHCILEKQRLHFKEDYSSASNSNFLSMEYQVLDNLPHDLVYSPDQVSPWMEVWIEKIKGRFVTFVFSEYLQNIAANLYPLLCTSQLKSIYVCFYVHCLCGISSQIIEIHQCWGNMMKQKGICCPLTTFCWILYQTI